VGNTKILNDVSFEHEGGTLVVIGPNGSGKTTLLRSIAGLTRYSGVVEIEGLSPARYRNYMSYVPAQPSLDPMARGLDIGLAMNYRSPGNLWRQHFREWLATFGVEGLTNRAIFTMSSGEQRLLLIAAALSRTPRLLLLDEPTAFLDMTNQAKVMKVLAELSRSGVTIVMATHDLHYASLADNVAVLSKGRLVAFGSPREVLNEGLLSKVYSVSIKKVNDDPPLFLPELF